MRSLYLALAIVVAAVPAASAQPADLAAHVKIIDTQPADMDKTVWKEKRRDAARKLASSKDKRAVPTLIKLAETETFDIIGEIAIEGLGSLGDQAAVPALQRIANDTNRDKTQRDLAKKSLAKLGATPDSPVAGGTTGGGTTTSGGDSTATGGTDPVVEPAGGGADLTAAGGTTTAGGGVTSGGGLIGERPAVELRAVPDLPEDTIAAYDRLTFAIGAATLAWDSVRERMSFDVDVEGWWRKRIEREKLAWGFDAGAHVVAGMINPSGRAQSRGAQINVSGKGEARFYSGKLYGIGKVATALQLNYVSDVDGDPGVEDFKETRTIGDFQLAIGGGYGRLLDVGALIRVRRLGRALDAARALGKPIDAQVARKLQLTWWSLRGERSAYKALIATVAILREAGILLGEPDAGLTYEILNVLRDSQLFLRPSGLDVQVAFAEGYLYRPDLDDMGTPSGARQDGRVESLLALAGYGLQLQDDKLELSGSAFARLRLFAPGDPDPQPSPWGVGAGARMRRFAYGAHGDPLGVFDLGADIQVSDDDFMDGELGARLSGELGFTVWVNQASGFRLSANLAIDGGERFIGAQLEATYGLLDGTFAGL